MNRRSFLSTLLYLIFSLILHPTFPQNKTIWLRDDAYVIGENEDEWRKFYAVKGEYCIEAWIFGATDKILEYYDRIEIIADDENAEISSREDWRFLSRRE